MSKFIFIQYTAGAGGKAVSCCLQTADKVGSWWSQQPSPGTVASFHTNDVNHVKREPDPDYILKWLSKTYGIDRGDHLTKEEVVKALGEEKALKDIIKNKKYITVPWNKKHMPLWFEGKLIQIINDESSLAWLADRRKKILYVESDEGLIEVRYDSRYNTKPERNDRRVSSLNIDELIEKQLKEEMIVPDPIAHQIQLSWILDQQWSKVFDVLENSIDDKIDRIWCGKYLTDWHKKIYENTK